MVQASKEHLLPELYDAETGDAWYVNVYNGVKEFYDENLSPINDNLDYGKGINDFVSPSNNDLTKGEEKLYNLAIRRLEKGELVTNNGKITSTKRIFDRTVYDIDNRFSREIKMGVNKGNFQPGVTTKGINQIQAMVNRGVSGVGMKVVNVSKVSGDLLTVATMMVDAANGDQMDIPFMSPFVPMIVDQQIAEMNEENHERFLKELNVAKATGNIKTIQEFFGKNDLYYSEKPNFSNNNGLIIQYKEIKDEYGREIFVYYIHAIYLNNFFENN